MYIFSGYVNGDKSNDMWKFDLASKQWTCLNKGDYKLDVLKQNSKKIPAPRVGCRMIQLSKDKLLVHNGHDNDNEKICDMWTYDLTNNTWTEINQKGDTPPVSFSFIYFEIIRIGTKRSYSNQAEGFSYHVRRNS